MLAPTAARCLGMIAQNFTDFYRCPDTAGCFAIQTGPFYPAGYFRFGDQLNCYANTSAVPTARHPGENPSDALDWVRISGGQVQLPFDPDLASNNLRQERYLPDYGATSARISASRMIRDLYYAFRPLLPVTVRSALQRIHLRGQLQTCFPNWPVDRSVDRLFETMMQLALRANGNEPIPFIWFWPEGKRAAFLLTHDVENAAGLAFCPRLMDLDSEFGFRSAFQLIPEKRYEIRDSLLAELHTRGFEVNVHDLNHDGYLFRERDEFLRRAAKINQYAREFGARGFRSGALYRRLDWLDALDVSYDMSVPNVAHLDPQNGGCCTVMPYFIGHILELPVTETQDYTLFHILKQYSIGLWKEQTAIILKGHGLISVIAHPDYLIEREARSIYRLLLAHMTDTCERENVWAALPAEVDRWWRMRQKMRLVRVGNSWQIEGEGRERARIAYATLVNEKLEYTISRTPPGPRTDKPPADAEVILAQADSSHTRSAQNSQLACALETVAKAVGNAAPVKRENADPDVVPSESEPAFETAGVAIPLLEPDCLPAGTAREKKSHFGKPLRVCMVAYTFYDADNRVMRYAETLAQEGHDVEVFALRKPSDRSEERVCGVKVHRLQRRQINEKGPISYAWRIGAFLLRAFFRVSVNDLKKRYDFIHVHSVPDFLVFTALLPRLRGTPVVLDIHDILPEFYLGKFGGRSASWKFRLLTWMEKISANFASHVIIANDLWRERLISRSIEPSRCTAVLNFPDPSIFHRSYPAPAKNERFLLLYPGTLNWHQGLDIAIRAFASISDAVPYADFHIYGDGPSKPLLADLIRSLHLEDRVALHAPRRLREIALIMAKADLGIVPKRKDNFGNEAFSTKIFEFMAVRVPVIVSDTKIDRYYFNDSLVRFFKGGDEDDLAQCMLDLIRHPEKRRTLVENAATFIQQNDWTTKRVEYIDLVARLTGVESSTT